MSHNDEIILDVRLSEFAYPGGARMSLPSFTLARGQVVVLTGRSGSGKSTLLHLVCGVQALTRQQGSIRVESTELAGASQHARDRLRPETVGWMPQRVHLISGLSVFDNVMLPRRFGKVSHSEDAVAMRARALIAALEIGSIADSPATQISVGQASRTCAARALAVNPVLLCADEPSAALDQTSASALSRMIVEYVKGGGAALVASHDPDFVAALQREHSLITTISMEPL